MGSTVAAGMAEAVEDGRISLRQAVAYHLQVNHYPPHPSYMVDVALKAIAAINRGQWNKGIRLPDGVTYRDRRIATAGAIADGLRLGAFIEEDD